MTHDDPFLCEGGGEVEPFWGRLRDGTPTIGFRIRLPGGIIPPDGAGRLVKASAYPCAEHIARASARVFSADQLESLSALYLSLSREARHAA